MFVYKFDIWFKKFAIKMLNYVYRSTRKSKKTKFTVVIEHLFDKYNT